jgi:hypothetical protein
MADYVDLLLRLYRTPGMPDPTDESYVAVAEMRMRDPESITDDPAISWQIDLNRNALIIEQINTVEYGRLLTRGLFPPSQPQPTTYFARARDRTALAGAEGKLLRLRLEIDTSAFDLHDLRWETLVELDTLDAPEPFALLRNPRIPFSRFLASEPWLDLRLRPHGRQRALVVVVSPAGLNGNPDDDDDAGQPQVKPIRVAEELARAREGLCPPGDEPDVEISERASAPGQVFVTLNRLIAQLDDGYDLLYLVCHGDHRGAPRAPYLLLESADGGMDWVSGALLVEQIRNLPHPPLLVVLAACRSAGTGEQARSRDDKGALAALGPRLVSEAGVPAVLAMSGKVQMQSVAELMPVFFRALRKQQPIDQALATARNTISRSFDRYMPVLFMRLREGTLSYQAGFGSDNDATRLKSLQQSINAGKCVLILGPGLPQHLLGTPREWSHALIQNFAQRADNVRDDDLPQVAQYVATRMQREQLLSSLAEQLLISLLDRCRVSLEAAIRDDDPRWQSITNRTSDMTARACALLGLCGGAPPDGIDADTAWKDLLAQDRFALLDVLTSAVGGRLRASDPLRTLARQRHTIYITASPDGLLGAALRAEGREPVVECLRWHDLPRSWPPSIYEREPRYMPSRDRPLVLHLFGRYAFSRSLVLSEDDYFEYLMAARDLPTDVSAALVESSLLFLGFQVDDWAFRAVFRSLLNRPRRDQRSLLKRQDLTISRSIAVQLTPEQRTLSPAETRRYFNDFFSAADIDIYWGQNDDFVRELKP